jgi:hypothetical protein
MLRLLLLVILLLVVAGLGYLGFTKPAYHPQPVSQPVALPNVAR